MTRVEPFIEVAERFASQQETRFSVTNSYYKLVSGFPQACFMPFQKVVKSPPSAGGIEPPSKPYSYREEPPFQSRTSTNFKFLRAIEPAFIELEGKRNNHYTGRGYTRWDRWFMKSLSTSILRDWFPKRFARKCFSGLVAQALSVR
ncbi:hypothetical protein AVEN_210126-1 [Araneus ventricosus]|uniref:Uncharacterized protein n=1 Tax=Araneus ventricosus TaxID=182803 RepID=A0A4Y2MHD2_ARAVE|nr:hypothetical protein AVEN_210126-1 [Araneus ventricosus]